VHYVKTTTVNYVVNKYEIIKFVERADLMKKINLPQNDRKTGKAKTPQAPKPFSFEEIEKIFLYFSTSILEKNTEEEILWDLAKNCISQLGFEDCVIYLLEEEKQVLAQKAAYGPKNPKEQSILQPIAIPVGSGITGSVALSGVAEIIEDTSKDPRYIVDDVPRLSEIAVPILMEGKVLGVIDCEHPEPRFFTPQHLRILTAMASICAIKLCRVRAEQRALREQKRLLEAQRQMGELKAQALKAQMNPHFLFNALNAVQYFITSDDKKVALSYMSLLGKLIRYRLEHFQDETASLSQEIEVLGWYLKLQQLRYGDKFTYSVETPGLEAAGDVKIPSLVLPFIIESAVETSMLDQPAGHVQLMIKIEDEAVGLQLLHNLRSPEESNTARLLNYRQHIEPWQKQVEKLNALQAYQIREKSTFMEDAEQRVSGVSIHLNIPILK